jgi:hydrocephalus-inducing protein
VSQFTLDPAEVVVKPGCKQQVSVVFRAEANCAWTATVGLDISERDHRDQPAGIPYELGGDSCIPGKLSNARSLSGATALADPQAHLYAS